MGYGQLLELLDSLPPERRAEVLDFAQFLAARHKAGVNESQPTDWTADTYAQLSMAQALRGMEEDPVTYSRDDLKELWS